MSETNLQLENAESSLESTPALSLSQSNLPTSALSSATELNPSTSGKPEEPVEDPNASEQTDVDKRSSLTNQMPIQNTGVYTCQTDSNNLHSVLQLRDYFSGLDEATKRSCKVERHSTPAQNRKASYTISVGPILTQPDDDVKELGSCGTAVDQHSRSTSVEELRRIFESSSDTRIHKQGSLKQIYGYSTYLNSPKDTVAHTSKSVEFYSRLPNVRTPSPQPIPLPTPPPLPLPPSHMLEGDYHHSFLNHSVRYHGKNKLQSEQFMRPKSSKHLPFRSRSLALERSEDGTQRYTRDAYIRRFHRRQTSTSPTRVRHYKSDAVCQTPTSVVNHSNAQYRKPHNQERIVTAEQTPYRSTPTINRSASPITATTTTIARSDGVYIRSAVVYERVPDQSETGGEKRFVTTYIISNDSHPSQSTVQATNLWVTERSLATAQKQPSLPPHRTQALSPTRFCQSFQPIQSAMPDRTANLDYRHQMERAVQTGNYRHATQLNKVDQAQPMTEMQPEMQPDEGDTRSRICSYNKSLPTYHQRRKKNQYQHRRRLYRTWSVKSLSPPPFRSQWLSSLSNPKIDQQSEIECTYPSNAHHDMQSADFNISNKEYYNTPLTQAIQRHRQVEIRDRRAWLRRAESISRERRKYHQLRGSWSPPYQRSPARNMSNDIEEPTEAELRQYIRYNLPVPIVPQEPPTHDQAIQTNGIPPPSSKQLDKVKSNRFQSDIDATPITENFDEKRVYFEDLIRTNKLLARCSFCSDCYHCAPNRCSNCSPYSSWGSDLQIHPCAISQEPLTMNQIKPYAAPQQYCLERNEHLGGSNRPLDMWNSQTTKYNVPQREDIFVSQVSPMSFNQHRDSHRLSRREHCDSKYSHQSIDHDYYAKPRVQMPKVAPNPPIRQSTNWDGMTRNPFPPPEAELVRSPMVSYDAQSSRLHKDNRNYMLDIPIQSTVCRSYDKGQHYDSYESLYCDRPSRVNNVYHGRGRVKHIASQLDNLISQTYQPEYEEETYRYN